MRFVSIPLVLTMMLALTACGGGGESSSNVSASADSHVANIFAEVPFSANVPPYTISESQAKDPNFAASMQALAGPVATSDTTTATTTASGRQRHTQSFGTDTGWITDVDDIWPQYNFLFTVGSAAVSAPTPPNSPTVSGVSGLPTSTDFTSGAPYANPWASFLSTSVACYPACALAMSDIATGAALSAAANNPFLPATMGSAQLDDFWLQHHNQIPQMAYLASALDKQGIRLLTAWAQLDKLIGKSNTAINGPVEYQYALMAKTTANYPDVRHGFKSMKMGDVWKFGTSLDPDGRYPQVYLDALGVSMVIQTEGNRIQVLTQEKANLIAYYIGHGELPPGNKIFK